MKKILITGISLLLLNQPLMAKEKGIKINGTLGKNANSVIVQVEGVALLGDKDTPEQTRASALVNAKRNAAESALTKITSTTTVDFGQVTEDVIVAKAKADVIVLEQTSLPTVNNEYKVKIKAEVRIDETPEKKVDTAIIDPTGQLKVLVWTPKTNYTKGEKLNFSILSNRDAYLVVNYIMANGSQIQLFPNDYSTNNYVKGGETITIPSKIMKFDFEVSEPFGAEKLVVYASTSKIDKVPTKEAGTRGIVIKAKTDFVEFSEASVGINTSK